MSLNVLKVDNKSQNKKIVDFVQGRREIAKSARPLFRGIEFRFYSTNLQFLVMCTLNDIFHIVLRVKDVLSC